MSHSSRVCIVLAAGQGTRMKSELPKVLHPVAGWPMVLHAVEAARAVCDHVVVVVGHGRELVERVVRERYSDGVSFAVQTQQRGTADAVRAGLEQVSAGATEVLITYGDCPCVPSEVLSALVEARSKEGVVLALATAKLEDPTGYGRVLHDSEGRVSAVREHKDASSAERSVDVVNAGLYAVEARFLRERLSSIGAGNAQGEFYLTDLVALAHAANGGAAEVRWRADVLRGVNDRAELAELEALALSQIADRWRRAGNSVTAGARIERDVVLGGEVSVGHNVVLRGKTQIAKGAVVDVGCVLEDAIVGERALLKPYTIVTKSRVGHGAQLGPFAHLRPGSDVGEDAHVGNFVELKNTTMHKSAKANHLAYLGDGEIGERANIGAGTIFCNYDGFQKHKTDVHADAFVGSNSSLVAPITVGAGAYVGSGSVVTKDVPPGALAVGRARQENKEGYADRIRALKKKK